MAVLLGILYIAIGLFTAGFMYRNEYGYEDHLFAKGLITAFWPLILGGFLLYLFVIGTYRLGEYIGNKIDEIKSR